MTDDEIPDKIIIIIIIERVKFARLLTAHAIRERKKDIFFFCRVQIKYSEIDDSTYVFKWYTY